MLRKRRDVFDKLDQIQTLLMVLCWLAALIFIAVACERCGPQKQNPGVRSQESEEKAALLDIFCPEVRAAAGLNSFPSPEDPNFIGWFMAADPNTRAEFMDWYRASLDYNTQPEEPNEPVEPPRISTPEQWEIECLGLMALSGQWLGKETIVDEMNSVFAPVNFEIPASEILKWVKFQERKAVLTLTIDNWGIARLNLKKIALLSEDLNGDGRVDLNDVAVKSRNWMKGN